MSEKICECGHGLSEHFDSGASLICQHFYEEPGCHCLEFVWETGDEESDPQSPKFVDWGTASFQ